MGVRYEYVEGLSGYEEYVGGRFVTNLIDALAEAEYGSKREVYNKIGISRGTLYSGYKASFLTKKKVLTYALEKLDTAEVVRGMLDDLIYTLNMLVFDAIKALKAQGKEDEAKGIFDYTYKHLDGGEDVDRGGIPRYSQSGRGRITSLNALLVNPLTKFIGCICLIMFIRLFNFKV